jgi:hypothetical protein
MRSAIKAPQIHNAFFSRFPLLDNEKWPDAVIFGIGVTVCRITIAPWSIQSPFTVHGPTSRPSAQDTNRRKSD